MPTPSLLIVPARFKTGKLYSQIPESGAGDFTVTRNTAARRFGPDGLIASVASGIPRLDYYTSGGVTGCPALLVEPAGTNLCKYSEQFDTVTSGWTAIALQTITGNTNATLDPAGGNTADLIVGTSGNAQHYLQANTNNLPSLVSGTTYTFSVFAKATSATSGFVQFIYGGIGFSPVNPYANFQLSGNGAVTTGTFSAASIQPFGNGWYRCAFSAIATASGTATFFIQPILASGVGRIDSFVANGVDGVYLWGAQIETGSVATSYIPTTAGTGSRSADVVSVSGAVSGSIGQTEGTIYLEVEAPNASQQVFAIGTGGTNSIHIYKIGSSQYKASINGQSGGGSVDLTDIVVRTGYVKLAVAYKSGQSALVVNGSTPLTSATALTFGALTSVNFFGSYQAALPFRVRAVALYNTRLTNAELQALTAP